MVVIDGYDGTQSRKPPAAGALNAANAGGPTTHPDAPPPYGAPHGTYHVPTPGEDRRLLEGPPDRQPAWLRFGKALLVAIVVYALCASLLGSWLWSARGGGSGPSRRYNWPSEYPIPVGVNTRGCLDLLEWGTPHTVSSESNTTAATFEYPYASMANFELPLSSKSLYLLSRGAYSAGSVDILTSAEQRHDSVSMRVTMKHYSEDVKRVVKVCRVSRMDGEDGVGLFSPSQRDTWPGSQVFFETLIVFPEVGLRAPLVVPSLETDVHNTLHRVHAVLEQVKFAKLRLQGTNGPIQATSLSADEGLIQTSNAEIYGSFNATKSLDISSTNAAILVSVKMVSGYNDPGPFKLDIRTTNGPVEANIDLYTASKSGKNGRWDPNSTEPTYYANTSTSNSRMQTNFWHQPADSTLIYHGSTTNGFAQAQLHSAYQGEFEIQTSNATPQLHVKEEHPSDPSGRGRGRKLETRSVVKGRMTGTVEWVGGTRRRGISSDAGKGRAVLQTTNSQAVLVV